MLRVRIDGEEVHFLATTAPMGERHVHLKSVNGVPIDHLELNGVVVEIYWLFQSSVEFVDLILIVNALKIVTQNCELVLNVPYVPFCRQDRVCNPGENFSLRAFADVINMLNFSRVNYVDGHSYATGIALNNSKDNYQAALHSYRDDILRDFPASGTLIIIPDAGAVKRVGLFMEKFGYKTAIQCIKKRGDDGKVSTTNLLTFKGIDYEKYTNALIVDDIFDGGATFSGIAEAVKSNPVTAHMDVNVLVTHGGFTNRKVFESGNIKAVKALFNYCTDSDWLNEMKSKGTVL